MSDTDDVRNEDWLFRKIAAKTEKAIPQPIESTKTIQVREAKFIRLLFILANHFSCGSVNPYTDKEQERGWAVIKQLNSFLNQFDISTLSIHDVWQRANEVGLPAPLTAALDMALRGSAPTHLVLCHRAGQKTIDTLDHIAIPPLNELIALYDALSTTCGIFTKPTCIGICLN